MAATTFGWLVLRCPLVGNVAMGLGYRRLGSQTAGWIGTAAIAPVRALVSDPR